MIKLLLISVFAQITFVLSGEPIAVFEKPVRDARVIVADRKFFQETGNKSRHIINSHPLAYIHEFYEVKSSNGLTGFYRPDVIVKEDGKSLKRCPPVPVLRITGAIASAVLLLFLLWKALRSGLTEKEIFLIPILLRIMLLLITLSKWENIVTAAADEGGYFKTAFDMLKGDWRGPWSFTIGTGLFYMPFIIICKAKEFYDIVPYFNYFTALVLAPMTLGMGFLILRKLGVSKKKSCIAMCIWAVFPFVAFHLEDWNNLLFQQFFLLPQWFSKFDGRFFYGSCINAGFNAMSDIPGLLVLLCAFYTAVAMPAKYRYACLFGAVYALACLIRINYIIIAPLFICIFLEKFKSSPRELFTAAAAGAGAFLLCFAPQFICNTIQFGSPLTFGYILHYPEYAPLDRPAAGFTWHTFSKLTFLRYLIQVNLPVFAIGTAALWCMRDRRNQMLLVLLAVPLVIFFCGYSHTFCDARRFVFPAFAAMLMALAAAEFWSELSWKELLSLCAALIGTLLFTTPWSAPWQGMPLALGDSLFLKFCAVLFPCFAGAVTLYLWVRKKYLPALFLLLSFLFFHLPPFFLASGMFLLLPWLLVRRFFHQEVCSPLKIQKNGQED